MRRKTESQNEQSSMCVWAEHAQGVIIVADAAPQAIGHTMLDEKRIREIAQEVATANLTSANVSSVSSSAAVDSEGHDALRITIVIKPGSASKIKGDATLDTLVGIQDRLRAEGEERFPIVEYATKKELSASGGS
jgi:hypothetical protein